ncbi:MAG: hypothetical protein V1783_00350 [Bacteroidota bacterium]
MVNFSTQSTRRIEWTFGIAYGDDSDKAKSLLISLVREDERVFKDPETFVAMSA